MLWLEVEAMAWYTFTMSQLAHEGDAQFPAQVAFAGLWNTSLFRSPEACLFVGAVTARGLRFYLSIPEAGEFIVQDYLRSHQATPFEGVPEETEVRVLVGNEQRAQELWEARITCSRENPEACVVCSG